MYQPKTGAKCSCRRGVERDNCPNCEGTGYVIDFAKIRATNIETKNKVETVLFLLNREGVKKDDASPNFVNLFAFEYGFNLTSDEVVKISNTY